MIVFIRYKIIRYLSTLLWRSAITELPIRFDISVRQRGTRAECFFSELRRKSVFVRLSKPGRRLRTRTIFVGNPDITTYTVCMHVLRVRRLHGFLRNFVLFLHRLRRFTSTAVCMRNS